MDLNQLTRDADDLIRKVVSRYNQLYSPAGNISQLELDLMLDDMRKLYDTFKIIEHINLTLHQGSRKPEVSVNTTVPTESEQKSEATHANNEKSIPTPEPEQIAAPPEPEQKPEPESKPESQPEFIPEYKTQPEISPEPELEPEPALIEKKEPEPIVEQVKAEEPIYQQPPAEISEKKIPAPDHYEKNPALHNPEPSPAMLADRFNSGNKSLSETLASAQPQGVAGSRLLFHPIADLSSGIGLNDKFSFISELFENNPVLYDEAITRINKAVNADEASWILQKYHTHEWDKKAEILNRLKDFVKRRFI